MQFSEIYLNLEHLEKFMSRKDKIIIGITCRRFKPEKTYQMRILKSRKVIYDCTICRNFVEEILLIRNISACEKCVFFILSHRKFVSFESTYFSVEEREQES